VTIQSIEGFDSGSE